MDLRFLVFPARTKSCLQCRTVDFTFEVFTRNPAVLSKSENTYMETTKTNSFNMVHCGWTCGSLVTEYVEFSRWMCGSLVAEYVAV